MGHQMVLTRAGQNQNSTEILFCFKKQPSHSQNEFNPCLSGLETFRSEYQIQTDLFDYKAQGKRILSLLSFINI